jgi:hypothetical protein
MVEGLRGKNPGSAFPITQKGDLGPPLGQRCCDVEMKNPVESIFH